MTKHGYENKIQDDEWKGVKVVSVIRQTDKRSGITYVYESKAYWDKEKKQSRSKRVLLGKLDPETGEIVPTDGRGKKRGFAKHEIPKEDGILNGESEMLYQIMQDGLQDEDHSIFSPIFLPGSLKNMVPPELKKSYALIQEVLSMSVNVTLNGAEYESGFIFYDSGRSARPDDFTEGDYSLLKSLDFTRLPLVIRAKIADLLWIKRKDYPSAVIALQSYMELYQNWFSIDDWTECVEMMQRVLDISRRINDQKTQIEALRNLKDQALQIFGKDGDFLSNRIIQLLIQNKYGNADEYISLLDKIIINQKSSLSRVEDAFELMGQCYKWKNDSAGRKKTKLRMAEYYVNLAAREEKETKKENNDVRDLYQRESYLKNAIRIYKEEKEKQKAEKLEKQLEKLQRQLPGTLQSFTISIDTTGLHKYIFDCFDGLSAKESLIRLTQFTLFRPKELLKEAIQEDLDRNVFTSLASRTIMDDEGRTICDLPPLNRSNLDEDEKLLNLHLYHKGAELENNDTILLSPALKIVAEKFKKEGIDLDFLTYHNGLVPEGREDIFSFGLKLAMEGKIYEAVHILVPQVENLFRCLAEELGGRTTVVFENGVSERIDLRDIFNLKELNEAFMENILFTFRGLLIEHAGSNLRNEVAHGLLDKKQDLNICIYFVCAVIKLLVNGSPECLALYRDTPKLQELKRPPEGSGIVKVEK